MRRAAVPAPTWAPLLLVVGLSALLRFWGALGVPAPWIAADEMVYAELGRSLFETGKLEILGHETGFYSLIYPLLVGLPLSRGDVAAGYDVVKLLQAVAMSLAAVPAYIWARRLANVRYGLLAAALTAAIPGLAYAGFVMTEVAFYPVAALAAWALACALERPTRRNQALLVGAALLAAATRLQALVLLPVVGTAVGIQALLERSTRTLRELWPTVAALVALFGFWAGAQLLRGGGPAEVFGAYEAAGRTSYDPADAARYLVYHLGDAILFTGVVPTCALALLCVEAARRQERDRGVRALSATAVALAAWLIVEVGIFASRHVRQLAERDLLALAPPLFVAFAVWLARGAPRTRLSGSLVALAVAAPVLALPLDRLVSQAALPDAFTLAPLYVVRERSGMSAVELIVYTATAIGVLAVALLPRRLLPALTVALLAALAVESAVATHVVADQARLARAKVLGPDERWIDEAARGSVAYLYDGDSYWNAVWEQLFWNRRIRAVYRLPYARRVPGPLHQPTAQPLPDGRMTSATGTPILARYLVASSAFTFFGEPVAQMPQVGATQEGLVLWRLDAPPRMSTAKTGVHIGGDIYDHARLVAYDCRRGALGLTLIGKGSPLVVTLRSGGAVYRRVELEPVGVWRGEIPARPKGGACDFDVETNSIVGSTRFEFVRL